MKNRSERLPLISVIVPVYRAEDGLEDCVRSILAQSYRRLEVILVDDGSPDRCPEICDAFAREDARVRVIHQENGGVSRARNAGLAAARGEYIGFVDSDDVISRHMYERLLVTCLREDADLACCGYRVSFEGRVTEYKAMSRPVCFTAQEALKEYLLSRNMHAILWNKLYRREVLAGIHFPEGENYEDGAVMHRILGQCRRAAHCGACCYEYRKGQPSITKLEKYERMKREVRHNYEDLAAYVEASYPALRGELKYYELECRYYVASRYLQEQGSTRTPEYARLRRELAKRGWLILRHPGWSARKKGQALLMVAGVYQTAWQMYHRLRAGVCKPGSGRNSVGESK